MTTIGQVNTVVAFRAVTENDGGSAGQAFTWCLSRMCLFSRGHCLAFLLVVSLGSLDSCPAQAEIYRWDNGELIPGTEGITPGPDLQLDDRNLRYASLAHVDLSRSSFQRSDLTYVLLTASDLRHTNLSAANMTNAILKGCQNDSDSCRGADFTNATLAGANLSGAIVSSSIFEGADLRNVNLTNAELYTTRLAGADLDGAIITGSLITAITRNGFTKEQLYSTANYNNKDLRHLWIKHNDFSGWDFSGQNLTDTSLSSNNLTDANLSGVIAIGTIFGSDLDGADFRGANLSGAVLGGMGLESAIFDATTVYSQWTVFPDGFDPVSAGLTLVRSASGDFDGSGQLDAFDVDQLMQRIRGDAFRGHWPDEMLDVDGDTQVGMQDLDWWIKELKSTGFGDANLDGQFNSGDLVDVFEAGKYHQDVLASWSEGDWNADGLFDSGDLVAAFQDGGYVAAAMPAIPEPTSGVMMLTGLIGLAIVSNTRRKCALILRTH